MEKLICIYHKNCADGFTAAWIFRNFISGGLSFTPREIQWEPRSYGEAPPDCTGAEVIILDFSFKRPVMKEIAAVAKAVLVIDHHKTAQEDMQGLMEEHNNVKTVFDMERSGARLAWDYFFHGEPLPDLVRTIEDRDLWRFKFSETRAQMASIFSYAYDFETWDDLSYKAKTGSLDKEGEAIERKHFKDITELMPQTQVMLYICGEKVPAYNLPYTMSSDVGNIAAAKPDHSYGVCFWFNKQEVQFSLRSIGNKQDVSLIASAYGGGGHRNAAGFKVTLNDFLSDMLIVDGEA
jgi:oligoribonuclease NrnB/cAMP/cGMP phosphodiesterase (DHH superfamily)